MDGRPRPHGREQKAQDKRIRQLRRTGGMFSLNLIPHSVRTTKRPFNGRAHSEELTPFLRRQRLDAKLSHRHLHRTYTPGANPDQPAGQPDQTICRPASGTLSPKTRACTGTSYRLDPRSARKIPKTFGRVCAQISWRASCHSPCGTEPLLPVVMSSGAKRSRDICPQPQDASDSQPDPSTSLGVTEKTYPATKRSQALGRCVTTSGRGTGLFQQPQATGFPPEAEAPRPRRR